MITFSQEDKTLFETCCVDSDWRVEWDDDLQIVIAKDRDWFMPNHTRSYKWVAEEIDRIKTRRTSTTPKELL